MIRSWLVCALLAGTSAAQSTVYSFDSLNGSDTYPYVPLDAQDGWSEQTFRAGQRCGVTATLSEDGTQCLRFEEVGPGYGCDASRINDAAWSFASFSPTMRNAFFQADIFLGFWGGSFGLAHDTNGNGIIRGSEAGERGVRFTVGTQANVQLQLVPATGSAVRVPLASAGLASGQWVRVRVVMDFTAGAGGLGWVDVQNLSLGATELTPVPGLQGVPLGLSASSADATNPTLWDALWLHFEGATYMLDNVEVGRAGFARPYGMGCNGGGGVPVVLSLRGTPRGGNTVTFESGPHAPNRPGTLLVGVSDANYLGIILPLSLDPLFGTSGCSLYTSIDVRLSGVTSSSAPATLSFPVGIPIGTFSARFFVQTICFEPIPGGVSLSNGLIVQLP